MLYENTLKTLPTDISFKSCKQTWNHQTSYPESIQVYQLPLQNSTTSEFLARVPFPVKIYTYWRVTGGDLKANSKALEEN